MAEAYLNSLGLHDWQAISSGALAAHYAHENANIEADTIAFLGQKGLSAFTKERWEQLTQESLDPSDVTVCLSPRVLEECADVELPPNSLVWNITDVGEHGPIPNTRAELDTAYEKTFDLIVAAVDRLISH